MAAVRQVRSMEATAITTVFSSQRMAAGMVGPAILNLPMVSSNRGTLRLFISLAKLSPTHSLGHHTGVVLRISLFVLNAPVMIQYRGNANRMAKMTTTAKENT